MAERSLWYDSQLLRGRAGKLAQDACLGLDATAQASLLAHGDDLADISVAVAQRYFLQAGAVHAACGSAGFAQWFDQGRALLAAEPPNREAALAYFSVNERIIAQIGIAAITAWGDLGVTLTARNRRLAATFLDATAPLLGKVSGDALHAWAQAGLALSSIDGWRGEFFARAFFLSSPEALVLLEPDEFAAFANLAPALHPAVKEGEIFAKLPPGLHLLSSDDRLAFFAAVHRAAADDPRAAWRIFSHLPPVLRKLHSSLRSRVLRILACAAGVATSDLDDVTPVAAALVRDIPRALRPTAVDLALRAAEAFPRGSIALLRSLPAAYEEAPPAGVEVWLERGLALARGNPDAGVAFFARESRTSLKVLHASSTAAMLNDVQGTLRKYVQMMSGQATSVRAARTGQLRPELEEFPLENEIALPLQVDRFDTYEDNQRLFRLIAAQLAGRRLAHTYAAQRPAAEGKSLYEFLVDPEKPALLEDIFLVAEGYRVAARLGREFPGIAHEQRDLALRLLDRAMSEAPPPRSTALDLVLLWLLSDRPLETLPAWMRTFATVIGPCAAPLAGANATVDDALTIAEQLTTELAARGDLRGEGTPSELAFERLTSEAVYDMFDDDDGPAMPGGTPAVATEAPPAAEDDEATLDRKLDLDAETEDSTSGAPMSAEELQRLLESGVDLRLKQASGQDTEGLGLYISDLLGKVPRDQLDEIQRLLGDSSRSDKVAPRRWLERRAEGATYYYDEWDYHIQDYRQRWCRLLEVPVSGDSGEFFNQTLVDYADLIPDVRRQFQRIRPDMYRLVRGLEHGEDFDLNAVVDARIDRRAKRTPSSRLYVARQREEREVATLFLIDLSASTDEPFEAPATIDDDSDGYEALLQAGGRGKKARRIIDVTKEALVIMAEALEEIGDAYAIYGFSGHGRKNVEFYMVKNFNESLGSSVKGRIGALEPKRSTRMGAAVRHAMEKMAAVSARSRHIILLSDGFPQDFDYGQDRRSNVYGLRDTTAALREAEAAGIVPFCITVDKSGHDYLREMCDSARYMVIDDIASLPSELPKVYQRVVTT